MTGDAAEALMAARPAALARAVRLCDGDRIAAEELVTDVIGHLWERSQRREEVYETAYVVRSISNAWINQWRRQRRHAERVSLLLPRETADGYDRTIIELDVAGLLERLPSRQRQIVSLRYLEDLSQEDVARRLRLPQGTIASGSARALSKLRGLAS